MKIFLIFIISYFAIFNAEVDEMLNAFISGEQYTKGDYTGKSIYVTFLKDGYGIEKRPEQNPHLIGSWSPPYEMDVRCYLLKNKKIIKKINSLNDFQGFVRIDSTKKAIEFIRLRTSGQTYFLFRPNIMIEVYRKNGKLGDSNWIMGGASANFFKKHNLQELKVVEKKEYFEITRVLLVVPWTGVTGYPKAPKLDRVIEKVYFNGKYEIEKINIPDSVDFSDVPYPLPPK